MTRTMQPTRLRTGKDRTGKVSALLRAGHKLRVIQPDEDAEIAGMGYSNSFEPPTGSSLTLAIGSTGGLPTSDRKARKSRIQN